VVYEVYGGGCLIVEAFLWCLVTLGGVLLGWGLRGLYDKCNNVASKLIIKEKK